MNRSPRSRKKYIRKLWTPAEDALLRKLYPTTLTSILCKKMKRTTQSIYAEAVKLGLKKDPIWHRALNQKLGQNRMRSPAFVRNRFRKGVRLPHQAAPGMKCFVEGGKKSRFKKGHLPKNTKYDGAISIRYEHTGHNGKKRPVQMIRIGKAKWIYLHRYVWEKYHGKIPIGFRVMFKDRDSLNCDPGNLVLRSAAEAGRVCTLYDETIALHLSSKKGGKGLYDKDKQKEFLNRPALLNAKRAQLMLQQQLKKAV